MSSPIQPKDRQQARRVHDARTALLLDAPWYGNLAMHLALEEADCKTAATDGTRIKYNPAYTATISDRVLKTLLAHEVEHCALLHPYRRGNRDLREWNEATDYVINGNLAAQPCFELWPGALLDAQYSGLSAETIYAQRHTENPSQPPQPPPPAPQPQPQPGGQQQPQQPGPSQPQNTPQQGQPAPGQGQPQPGEVEDAPVPAAAQQPGEPQQLTVEDWKIITEQASQVARKAGQMPGGVDEAVHAARESREDWRATMREFIEHQQPSDYSFRTLNRRFIAQGLYLPGITKENLGRLIWITDSSGSMDARALAGAWSEFTALVKECKPERILYLTADTRPHFIGEYTADTLPDTPPVAKGRGGTSFQPSFDWIADQEEDAPPAAVLYFSDLDASDQPEEPEYPVLFITGLGVTKDAPFGRTVRVEVDM